MQNSKLITTLIMAIAVATLFLAAASPEAGVEPLGWANPGNTPDPASWYYLVKGVLDSDRYTLYPFERNGNLTIGFSIFGELIHGLYNISLWYKNVDVFAPGPGFRVSPSIPKEIWYQGWLINITYYNGILGRYRNVWATAQFADPYGFVAYGGDWVRVQFPADCGGTSAYGDSGATGIPGCEDPTDRGYRYDTNPSSPTFGQIISTIPMYSGRKTNGTVAPPKDMPQFQILYDGPRRFIARIAWDIYDYVGGDSPASNIPLVRLIITIDYDKVKKVVVEIKEVKSLLDSKIGTNMTVQLSNRGEIDLGNDTAGYAPQYWHFFTQGTCPAEDTISEGRTTVYNYADWPVSDKWGYVRPPDGRLAAVSCYRPVSGFTYDVLQSYNPSVGKVFFAAFWPSLNDWTGLGFPLRWKSMHSSDPHYIDSSQATSPLRPFYIAEWDFQLYAVDLWKANPNQYPVQFRAVAIYGIVDAHNVTTTNYNMGLDREALYLLEQYFNPYDLVKAAEKDTARWVNFFNLPGPGVVPLYIPQPLLDPATGVPVSDTTPVPASWYWDVDGLASQNDWYSYSTFSERVIRGGSLIPPGPTTYSEAVRMLPGFGNATYTALDLKVGGNYKVLFSTDYKCIGEYTYINATFIINRTDFFTTGQYVNRTTARLIVCYKDVLTGFNFSRYLRVNGTDFRLSDWRVYQPNEWTYVFFNTTNKVIKNAVIYMDYESYDISSPFLARGAYEWIVVGRESHPVDSAGAAAVSEAFDSIKDIAVQWTALDAKAFDLLVPYVFREFRTPASGPIVPNYHYNHAAGDHRTALKDDWSKTVPIASSNMIFVGGPLVNLGAEYFNEFAPFVFASWTGMAVSGDEAYRGMTVTPTGRYLRFGMPWVWVMPADWGATFDGRQKNSTETARRGEGVVYVFKDLNGTVGLVIYGFSGEDTWAIAQSFFEPTWITYYRVVDYDLTEVTEWTTLLQVLQNLNEGTVGIKLVIDWMPTMPGGDPHPRLTVVEQLGTISEKPQHPDP